MEEAYDASFFYYLFSVSSGSCCFFRKVAEKGIHGMKRKGSSDRRQL